MIDPTNDLRVLAIGDRTRSEFCDAIEWFARRATLVVAAGVAEAEQWLRAADNPPTLILLLESHPGEYRSELLEGLRRLAPLARFIALLGSWCEGETTSGQPCAGVWRTYWHQWRPRLMADIERFLHGVCPLWGLPPTASDDELWLRLAGLARKSRHGLIAIHAPDRQSAGSLMDACHSVGYATVWLRPPVRMAIQGVTACLWDVPPLTSPLSGVARRVLEDLGSVPLIALLSFPRLEAHRELRQAGAAAVVSKPYRIDDLLWHLDEVTQAGSRGARPGPKGPEVNRPVP